MTHIFDEQTKIIGEVDVGADIATPGGTGKISVEDSDQIQLLSDVLKELKKLNLYMSLVTDTVLTNQEV
jgi:hypothetical protein